MSRMLALMLLAAVCARVAGTVRVHVCACDGVRIVSVCALRLCWCVCEACGRRDVSCGVIVFVWRRATRRVL